jgi:3-deoxy-D-manno-octulosonic-acid transferase
MKPKAPAIVYRLLTLPLIFFWMVHGLRHGFKHGSPTYLLKRMPVFGRNAGEAEARIWVHASSVGEVQSITPLVEALIAEQHPVLFTSFTATGYRIIVQNFSNRVEHGLVPVDFWWFCRSFFRRHKIRLGLIMETELWPELLYQAKNESIPLLQVNARLSKKSSEQPAYIRHLLANTLGYFSKILTRSERDQGHLLAMGVDPHMIEIVGNMKTLSADKQSRPRRLQPDYLLLASSHEGEELEFLQTRPLDLKDKLIVIAPRHPERSSAIQVQIAQLGLKCSVRSKAEALHQDTDVYLADTLGELKSLMVHAQLVVMGGSFDNSGGHNLIEPASLGCATITGPSDSNVQIDIDMLGAGLGLIQVADMDECWQAVGELLKNPQRAEALINEAGKRLAQQPDMIKRYLNAIKPWL